MSSDDVCDFAQLENLHDEERADWHATMGWSWSLSGCLFVMKAAGTEAFRVALSLAYEEARFL